MANTNAAITNVSRGVVRVSWTGLSNGSGVTGGAGANAFDGPDFPEKSVQVNGTFVGSAAVAIEGSNAATATGTYSTLTTPSGGNVAFTAAGVKKIAAGATRFIRPRMTTATSATINLTVTLIGQTSRT